MTADVELLPLPASSWKLCHDDATANEISPPTLFWNAGKVQSYARANVAHATAAKDAEIEALRAEVAEWKRVAAAQAELHGEAEAHAERLAEALKEAEEYIEPSAPSWYGPGQRMLKKIRALLREQEEGHE